MAQKAKGAKLYKALKVFDLSGDGFLQPNELKALLQYQTSTKTAMTDKDVKDFITRFDQNSDGKISITELVRAIGSEKEVNNIDSAVLRIQQARAKKKLRNPQPGDKLWYKGNSETFRSGSKVTHGTSGEVIGPTQSGLHLRMKFEYNKVRGDKYDIVPVYYTLLSRKSTY